MAFWHVETLFVQGRTLLANNKPAWYKVSTKQVWYCLAEGKQTLVANNKPAWYKVSTSDEQSFCMSKGLICFVNLHDEIRWRYVIRHFDK